MRRTKKTRDRLVSENLGLVVGVLRRTLPWTLEPRWEEDALQIGHLALCEAARVWDPKVGAFKTLAAQVITNQVRDRIGHEPGPKSRESARRHEILSLPELPTESWSGPSEEMIEEFIQCVRWHLRLRYRDKDLVELAMRRLSGETIKRVGQSMGLTKQQVERRDRVTRGVNLKALASDFLAERLPA